MRLGVRLTSLALLEERFNERRVALADEHVRVVRDKAKTRGVLAGLVDLDRVGLQEVFLRGKEACDMRIRVGGNTDKRLDAAARRGDERRLDV
jgi:hypothetical protein